MKQRQGRNQIPPQAIEGESALFKDSFIVEKIGKLVNEIAEDSESTRRLLEGRRALSHRVWMGMGWIRMTTEKLSLGQTGNRETL